MAKAKAKPASAPAAAGPAPGPDLARILPYAGLAVAVWASLPKYSGPFINTSDSAETADHIVPAVIVLLCSLVGIFASRRPQGPGGLRFIAGMGVLLSGLWMVATHFPLVRQTLDGGPAAASWAATIYHSASAIAVFGLGLLWSTVTWSEAGDAEAAKDAKTSAAKGK